MELVRRLMYRVAENDFLYRNLLNRRPSREFRRHQTRLCGEGQRVLDALNETGLAISHVSRFEGLQGEFERLRAHTLKVEEKRHSMVPAHSDQAKTYAFMSNLLGSFPRFDPQSPFTRFACQAPILEIINAYFGMYVQLRKYAVFRSSPEAGSENGKWHRDGPCDAMVLRVFAYFNDVGDHNGAMRYAAHTHSKCTERSRGVLPVEQLDAMAQSCAGPAGSLVFADTRGYHRAGTFTSGERWLFNSMYTSPGFGRDYFMRSQRSLPKESTPLAWALSSPLRLIDNLLPGRSP